ncbi:MAG: HAD family phosphatase [Bacteroidales bacterium]|nr:HAD family phosphatase [Bacteroidales bacterium]
MPFKGAVFDFNGTLLWDTALHNRAWDVFLERHQLSLTDRQKDEKIHGRNNELIFPAIFEREMAPEEIFRYVTEKEALYRELCLQTGIGFAPGAVDFIHFLKERGVRIAIATASGKENVDFYLDYLKLGQLVDSSHIVYNNGSYKSKPNPEIFLAAIQLLNLSPHEVVIFEDSPAGIEAARRANPGKVIVVDSNGRADKNESTDTICHFDEVDHKLFI